jgi:hypothetical protein
LLTPSRCMYPKVPVMPSAADASATAARLAAVMPALTDDQMRVVENLSGQRALAAAALSDAASLMRIAALRQNLEAFSAARASAEQAADRCYAATQALAVALAAFADPSHAEARRAAAASGLAAGRTGRRGKNTGMALGASEV